MKIRLLFLAVLLTGLSACEWGSPTKKAPHDIFTDTLVYTYQVVHERATDCGNKPDSTCSIVKIKYPLFKTERALNDTIKNRLLNLFTVDNKPDTGYNSMAKHFLKSYIDFKKQNPESVMYYTLDSYAKVIEQDSGLVAVEYGGYTFQGGAHGASFTGYINWGVNSKKNVVLDDILKPGTYNEFVKTAERIFRKDEKLKDTSSLARDYFFKDNKFTLNDNYSITPLGITFMYNQYEIKPYAAGQTKLFIPYQQIKSLMLPGSVAAQYIKRDAGI
ncbi:DUF3298 and DUF4163 domain-containing protein [Inquilinus sp. KBS0705]|nr:DUF3298 and DUF4163 domain-containing protein [Inquilinus sp. KBS0705]